MSKSSKSVRRKATQFDVKHEWLEQTERKLCELQDQLKSGTETHTTLGELVQCVHCALLYVCGQCHKLHDSELAVLESMSIVEYDNWMTQTE